MRWRIGLAAFVSPAVFVVVAFAHPPASATLKTMVENGVTFIKDGTASGDTSDVDGSMSKTRATIR